MITKELIGDFKNQSRVLARGAGFMYLLPHFNLRNKISNYTVTFPFGVMSESYSVVPHGSATLVISFDGNSVSSNFFGPLTKLAHVGSRANSSKFLFIIEFQPAGYRAFCGIPQKDLTDCVFTLDAVNPALNRLLTLNLETAKDIDSLIIETDRIFLKYLKEDFYLQEFLLAGRMIINANGLVSVKELSQNVFYSERHLNRIFNEYLGTGIKTFSKLVQINKAIRLLKRRDYSLAQICMETGFYDLPHFINCFKSICGITPKEYRNSMSDFYSEIAKFNDII